jgi:hypothetical protein
MLMDILQDRRKLFLKLVLEDGVLLLLRRPAFKKPASHGENYSTRLQEPIQCQEKSKPESSKEKIAASKIPTTLRGGRAKEFRERHSASLLPSKVITRYKAKELA